MTFIFGVLLPIVTLLVEGVLHMCAGVYVDPIPSWWHVTAIAFVAVANFFAWYKIHNSEATNPWVPFVIGASIGVSAVYAAVFAPLVPVSFVLMIFFGLGFLPLAPVCAFLCATRLAFDARKERGSFGMKGLFPGLLAGILFLVAAELPNFVTQIGLRQSIATSPEISRGGIRLLRTFGNEQAVLRSCYAHTATVSDIPSLLFSVWHVDSERPWLAWHDENHPLTIEQAREVYYRTYGRPFNSVSRPSFAVGLRSSEPMFDDAWYWTSDSELAGEIVGERQPGVGLANSQLVTTMNPDLGTSYSEWTMVFENKSYAEREARMQIALPPGGVVSRATLWVKGVQREAAFGERNLVRHAYQSVVASRRDPLLITSAGPDKIMLQCFPVPPMLTDKPGVMKVRIGITAPCAVPAVDEAALVLPRVAEHGFPIRCKHDVRIESRSPITVSMKDMQTASDQTAVRYVASVADSRLRDEPIVVRANRGQLRSWYTGYPLAKGKSFVLASLEKSANADRPRRVFVVVDGSAGMQKYMPQIASALGGIPHDIPTEVRFASDEITSLVRADKKRDLQANLRELLRAPCVGGPDNTHMLADVWKEAAHNSGSAVIWIHGPQPVLFGGPEVADAFELKDGFAPILFDVETFPSPNRLVEKLPQSVKVVEVPRMDELKADLQQMVAGLFGTTGNGTYVVAHSVSKALPEAMSQEIVEPAISAQLVSLWAYDQTKILLAEGKKADAVRLAARHRLVTPVTGAVVLETDADYKKNGIDKDNPDNNSKDPAMATPVFQIGAAPEPEEYALMAVALFAIAWMIWRRRLQQRLA